MIEAACRRTFVSCLAALAGIAGCHSPPDLSNRTEEEPPRLASAVRVADPQTASQLVAGWYPAGQNAWRWTARQFAVVLRPPIGAARTGAVLTLQFALPEVVLTRLKSVTLTASVAGASLAAQTYARPGDCTYVRDIPARLLVGDAVRIDFALDKALRPGAVDARELGLIGVWVGMEAR
ncbi:MAG TPA: hypothetical protein VLX58_12020 [Bryobacteraceae bacterium]|nr:hypothetical protein [Bryobacteraceae bacterium]